MSDSGSNNVHHDGAPLSALRADCMHGAIGVLEDDRGLLLIERSATVRAPGLWCFPGGSIEQGETPADAVVREFHEEVGLIVRADSKLWSWLRADGGLYLEWWSVHWVSGEMALNPDEVSDAAWMTDDEIRNHPKLIANNRRFLDRYRGNSGAHS